MSAMGTVCLIIFILLLIFDALKKKIGDSTYQSQMEAAAEQNAIITSNAEKFINDNFATQDETRREILKLMHEDKELIDTKTELLNEFNAIKPKEDDELYIAWVRDGEWDKYVNDNINKWTVWGSLAKKGRIARGMLGSFYLYVAPDPHSRYSYAERGYNVQRHINLIFLRWYNRQLMNNGIESMYAYNDQVGLIDFMVPHNNFVYTGYAVWKPVIQLTNGADYFCYKYNKCMDADYEYIWQSDALTYSSFFENATLKVPFKDVNIKDRMLFVDQNNAV